ncbi:UDP-glucose--hexose-1-phosphate uridylyltransferase [Algivirga pacifica]|uniref:Galactose-1-phosphate uridylyltransferase n=1 Tax=Algivirga pacifica TaxID=1162670 RepID=A0ABP9D4T7_9BACT
MKIKELVAKELNQRFGQPEWVSFSPGRINIIGEHTDYNDGFVLPAAVDKGIAFALRKNGQDQVRAYAVDLKEEQTIGLNDLQARSHGHWVNYIIGVMVALKDRGVKLEGYDLAFSGNVPLGAGMFSSAALECSLAEGLNQLFEGGLSTWDIALSGQYAEHHYVGVKCGIMDQFASSFGKENFVMKLDCRSKEFEYVPFDLRGYKLVLCNTKVAHSLASSAYNTRREQCEKGVSILKQYDSSIESLRDVSMELLQAHQSEMEEVIYQRCAYVVEENNRVQQACERLVAHDYDALGKLIYASHEGLSKQYEVSCSELDFLVEQTRNKDYVLGARMMGGGFGGCTINLVEESQVSSFIEEISAAYEKEFGIAMEAYTVVIGNGAEATEWAVEQPNFAFDEHPHRRYNPLTDEWVQVSPHRAKRPWQGQVEKAEEEVRPAHDPSCYLCAGNTRVTGDINPDYKNTYAFTNDFSSLLSDTPEGIVEEGMGLLKAKSERGISRVICFSPRHDLTIPEMEVEEIRKVVDLWCEEYETLGAKDFINYIQIFENKGAVMGCSNPHPHGQVWAQETIPNEPAKKMKMQKKYWKEHGRTLLSDYIKVEQQKKERVLFEDEYFMAVVPFWAVWPFEAMLLPKRPIARITDLTEEEKDSFAAAYKKLGIMYDNLFEISFPYSAGIHQAPSNGKEYPEWHMHMVFYPPLLRSATVKKFMVGYEMLANAQRDITPEQAAERLRVLSPVHYKENMMSFKS